MDAVSHRHWTYRFRTAKDDPKFVADFAPVTSPEMIFVYFRYIVSQYIHCYVPIAG